MLDEAELQWHCVMISEGLSRFNMTKYYLCIVNTLILKNIGAYKPSLNGPKKLIGIQV